MYTEYLSKRVADVAERDLLVITESTYVADAAKAMRQNAVTSVLVCKASDRTRAIGIVTEKDILYRVVAENRGPYKTTLGDIMSSPLITVKEDTTLRDAVILMRRNDIRRMPVVKDGGELVGMLALKTIIGNQSKSSISLMEVEPSPQMLKSKVLCPYCQSGFENKDDLSKHIDRLHLGSGLLEGDLRQW